MSTVVTEIPQQRENLDREVRRVFEKQQAKALEWRTSTAKERLARINKLKDALLDRREDLYKAAYADFKKPEMEVDFTEIFPVVSEARHANASLKDWMKPVKVPPNSSLIGTKSEVRYEPLGVSLIISPWNYPVNLTFGPLVSALAAGNTAMLKPSEMTPNATAFMKELVEDIFDESEVAIFPGAVEMSQALLALPFDHIFFTGSPNVGKIVMEAASKHLTAVTLELGGKSPVIVDKSAKLDRAAQNIVWGKFANNGQTCIAPDYLYVHEEVKEKFVEAVKSQIETMYGESPEVIAENPDYCRMVNDRHHGRVAALLEDAKAHGAKVVVGDFARGEDNYLAPTVLTDVPLDSRIMEEEIFGPVLPILGYSDLAEVVREINSRPKPLALYMWSTDNKVTETVLQNTSAGSTCVNQGMVQYLQGNLPFGGVNNSGLGKSHGIYGFRSFSNARSVLKDSFSSTRLLLPPYTGFVERLGKLVVRFMS